jgi:hypothetical protein
LGKNGDFFVKIWRVIFVFEVKIKFRGLSCNDWARWAK